MTRWVSLGVVALVVAIIGGVTLVELGNDNKSDSSNALPAGGRLDAGGRQLQALLATGRTRTWHAVYTLTPPAGESEAQKLEVWRRPGRSRQDTLTTSGPQPVHTVGLRLGKRVESCTSTGDDKWQCSAVSAASMDPDATFNAAIGEFGNSTVTPRAATVAGIAGKCFAIAAGGTAEGDGEVCVSTGGVPLRIQRGSASIEIVSLDTKVPDSVFTRPR